MALLALMLCSAPSVAAEATVGGLCEETNCEADTTLRVVEYFGADWCEPCRPVEAMLDGDYAEHAMRELRRRADANPDAASSSDSDDDAATVETASAETAPGNAHSWCVIS